MTAKKQSQFPARNKNAIYFERDSELSELNRQYGEMALDTASLAGRLGKKGMEAELDEVMQGYEVISETYNRKIHTLVDEMYLIGEHPPQNAFAAILNDIFTFLRIKKRAGDAELSESDALAFQTKLDEWVTVTQERNLALFSFLQESSEKHHYIDSLPDVPFTEKSKEKALGYVGHGFARAFGENSPRNSLPSLETEEMQAIGRQVMNLCEEDLGGPDISTTGRPVCQVHRSYKLR